tara:strand:- start:2632 stop:3564 length:933 start_codon:yes stop_codon:yes gene_type:complete
MIKLLIQQRKFSGGPAVFRKRITRELEKIPDLKVVYNTHDGFDIELSFIRMLVNHGKPMILRVDGCYYNPNQLGLNNLTKASMKKAKSIIFQSWASRKMCRRILGFKPKHDDVVYNGINFDEINSIKPDHEIKPGSFMAVAKWRENKRPKSMIRGFNEANTGRHLYVIGDGVSKELRKANSKNIHYLGKLSFKDTISVMKACQYQIHLCQIDSCPNAVVEGIVSGLNVLCTNLGGTKEIVKDNGVVLGVDNWDYRPKRMKNVDSIKPQIVADGIRNLMKIKDPPKRDDLNIAITAKNYAEIVRKVYYGRD